MTKRLPSASQNITRESDVFLARLLRRAEMSLRNETLPSRPDPKHVAILEKGAATWNRWRRDFPDVVPYLRGAFLEGTKLANANIIGARIRKRHVNDYVQISASVEPGRLPVRPSRASSPAARRLQRRRHS